MQTNKDKPIQIQIQTNTNEDQAVEEKGDVRQQIGGQANTKIPQSSTVMR